MAVGLLFVFLILHVTNRKANKKFMLFTYRLFFTGFSFVLLSIPYSYVDFALS